MNAAEAPVVYWTAGDLSRELGLTVGGANYWVNKITPAAHTRQGMALLTAEQAQEIIGMYHAHKRRAAANKRQREEARQRGASLRGSNTEDRERADRAVQYLLTRAAS